MFIERFERGARKAKGVWQQTAGSILVYRIAYLAWRAGKGAVFRVLHLGQSAVKFALHRIPIGLRNRVAGGCYRFVTSHFFTLVYPLNLMLAVVRRNVKYRNSVLHISYMVHIPYYTTRILRTQGVSADYLAIGGRSLVWTKYDYFFPSTWPLKPWREFWFFWRVVAKYEVIHSHFGFMLSWTGWELPILKKLGRKIVLHYRGCEARDPEKNMALHPELNICKECDYGGSVCREGKPHAERVKKYADLSLVTTPDLLDFVPEGKHLPFFTPEISYEKYASYSGPRTSGEEFKIVHVTNHPGIEGTEQILETIERLRSKGRKINFVFLRGVTPDRALQDYRDADLSIGKMIMGYYANAQIESMFLGVPAVTYVRPEFMTDELKESGLILTDLESLERTLEYYMDHPDALEEKRKIARSSILSLHDNGKLARRLIQHYREIGADTKALAPEETARLCPPLQRSNRPLRVLHIGNIANNAYYNAKFLRGAGVEADVLCYDDYWVMSSPEWEEADFDGVPSDQFLPDWWAFDLKGYERPRWFVQGPFDLCVSYLLAKQRGRTKQAARLWTQLTAARRALCSASGKHSQEGRRNGQGDLFPARCRRILEALLGRVFGRAIERLHHREYVNHCQNLTEYFARRFPDRVDRLTLEDLLPYEARVRRMRELFKYYDVVQGYATDPLYPMLADSKPYVAFEHGTLRDAPEWDWPYKGPFYDNSIGRVTALSYALADHVFITNADCLSSAQRLQLQSYEPMPHPLDENDFFPTDAHRAEIRSRVGAEIILFCPVRHDWVDKGTDIYIRVLPELRRALGDRFKVCFTPWGREIELSKQLIAELGCEDFVQWVGPFGKVQFARWLSAADVVFDQLAYLSFSGLTPRALSCGVPVIAAYDEAVTSWMFAEPAPVLAARTGEEVLNHTLNALNPEFRMQYRTLARAWVERYHSSRQVVTKTQGIYHEVVRAAASCSAIENK